ncbi:MAG: hypothetical protein Q8Q28_12375 [Pseudomonadota bacterium]|nr:hypothetical protein [Pseudomonadota bacterium]
MKRFLLLFAALLAGFGLAASAFAQVAPTVSVLSVVPSRVYVAADRAGTFTVTWQVRSSNGTWVRSTDGSFEPSLGTVPMTLYQGTTAGATVMFTENVRVPLAVIQKALVAAGGRSSFTYRRNFSDNLEASGFGEATVVLTGAQAAGLTATRQAIAFDDNTPVRIVAPRLLLGAWSEITLSGSGLVEGVWEIAEPPSTSGQAVFRTLRVVRQFAQGGGLRLDSPALPTAAPGLHLLRLRLTQPLPGFEAPEIRYFVAQPGATPVARELRALSPLPGALLEEGTRFTWAPLEGVQSWLLVLYERPAGLAGNLPELGAAPLPDAAELAQLAKAVPTAGIVVPGGQSGVALSAMARSRLKPGSAYLWRVLGVGKDAVVLGESPWRVIRVP